MRENLKKTLKICGENKLIIAIAVLSVFIIFIPHLQKGIIKGSDSPFHLARIESLAAELHNGTFPVKVHSVLCYDYGYGVGFFYQNHLLYIPALLQLLGLSLEVSFKVFAALMIIATWLLTFYGALCITKDKYSSALAATAFLFSNQILTSYYWDFSMGSSLGMIFIPLAIAGMIEFVTKNKPPIMLTVGFLGLSYTHLISAYMTFFVCLIILLAYGRQVIQSLKKVLYLILAAGSVLALSISFWLPMWEQFRQQTYKIAAPWTTPEENTIRIEGLFKHNSFGWLFMAWLCILGILIILKWKKLKNKRLLITLFLIDAGVIFTQLSKGFWIVFKPFVEMLQFPRRLVIVGIAVLVLAMALILSQFKMREGNKKIFISVNVAIVIVCAGLNTTGNLRTEREDYTGRIIYDEVAGIGAGEEWLPLNTTREMLTTPNTATANDGMVVNGKRENGRFSFEADLSKEYYDVPFIWYRGYKAVASDGTVLKMDKNPETSLVRVYMGESGFFDTKEVSIWYDGTKIQNLAYFANIMSILCLIGAVLLWNCKGKKWRGKE